jgi:uncharacterized protein (TIGR04222 family)
MNPFDLRGPEFLLFYAGLLIVTLAVVGRLRQRGELEDAPYSDTPWNDPYRIAFLRDGRNELLRVVVVSLVDRGLLAFENDRVQTTDVGRGAGARKRIEREVLDFFATPRKASDLFEKAHFKDATAEYDAELSRMRLLPDAELNARRRRLFYAGAAVLLFFSLVKMGVAIARGRTNLLFLIILTFIALVFLTKTTHPRLTQRGKVLLENVRNLFAALKVRAPQIRPGGASSEAVMLAAVFGLSALPGENFVWTRKLFPKTDSTASSSSGSSCSSSSCGSSCGGGGCGGGCGGCGG